MINDNDRFRPTAKTAPEKKLKTNRSLIKFILLSAVTLGVYGIISMTELTNSLNRAAGVHGRKEMHFCLIFFVVGPLTLGIGFLIWNHNMAVKIGNELERRGINYNLTPSQFWLFGILLLPVIIGPFIYLHKMFKAVNLICEDYNKLG